MAEGRRIEISRIDGSTSCIHLSGSWRLQDGLATDEEVARDVQTASGVKRITFDTKALTSWDSSLVTYVVGLLAGCRHRGLKFDCGGLPDGVQRLLALVGAVPEVSAHAVSKPPAGTRQSLGPR